MRKLFVAAALLFILGWCPISVLNAQPPELPARAFTNVHLHQADGTVVSGASIVWRGGIITASGTNIEIPFDARVIDGGDSLHVYPGFINGFTTWGAPSIPRDRESPSVPGDPGFERAGIQPERKSEHHIEDNSVFKNALKHGFTSAGIGLNGFMLPGAVSVFNLSDEDVRSNLLQSAIAQYFQFEFDRGVYPSTLMGIMAQLRQLFYDAEAHHEHHRLFAARTENITLPRKNEVLEALQPVTNGRMPMFVRADNREDIDRMLKLKSELGFNMVLISGNEAGASAQKLKQAGIPVLVSLDLPEKPEWMKEDYEAEDEITEEEAAFRQRAEEAYQSRIENIRKLLDSGIAAGFAGLDMSPVDIIKNMRRLAEYGYSEGRLITMMTANTARILGHSGRLGTLQSGGIANFGVFNGNISDEDSKAKFTVSAGRLYDTEDFD